ncbi:MAG TPA: radical SAM protein [bacterium]|nr:radical SAM protein [bacterium]HEX68105.1 radical SAM protein [bacterium]
MRPFFPTHVMIQTTSYCNSACAFCPYKEVKDELPQGMMEEKTFVKIVEELSRHKEIKRVMPYLMNEPLCDKEIVEKIYFIKEKIPWAMVHILTNGINLNEKLSEKLINSPIDWVGISIHAIREDTYRRFTGRKDFQKILAKITLFITEALKRRGKNFILINITHPPGYLTEEEKKEALDYWRGLGVERIEYFPRPISRAGNVKWLPQVRHKKIKGCKSIWRNEMVHILFNGDVVLCCMDWRREMILGNVNKNKIEEIWDSPFYLEVESWIRGEKEPPRNFLCLRCEEAIT